MGDFERWNQIVTTGLGDWSSVAGVVISIVGFGITIWNVWRSKSAAERANAIVEKLREDSQRMDFVAECSAAIGTMDQLKVFHRENSFGLLLYHYPFLRSKLIAVKNFPGLTEYHKIEIQRFLTSITRMEESVEELQRTGTPIQNVARYNKSISDQTNLLQDVMAAIKADLAERTHD